MAPRDELGLGDLWREIELIKSELEEIEDAKFQREMELDEIKGMISELSDHMLGVIKRLKTLERDFSVF